MRRIVLLLILGMITTASSLTAQEKCATVQAEEAMRVKYPTLDTKQDFENWMSVRIGQRSGRRNDPVVVPVVFHIIHNGQAIGSGDNISEAQVIAQVEQLNNDFGRVSGTSGDNSHPDGSETNIRFCLALTDPNGGTLAEPGINRINCSIKGLTCPPYIIPTTSNPNPYIESTLKPNTQWDPDRYLNIWVCRLTGGFIGYAQFPIGSGLPGLNQMLGADTDGVVVDPSTVGSTTQPASGTGPYRMGRTATHEIGHFFGLKHIWGDGDCSVDDFCDDTPESDRSNFGCPSGHVSCSSADMIENYMDYTDDLCMNIFTNDQSARMDVVLANSPRRMFEAIECEIEQECVSAGNHYIQQNTTWTAGNVPNGGENMGNIWIKEGVTLTINTRISFAPNTGLYVLSGSKVVLNSTLTSCDLWEGVRVLGNNDNNVNGPGIFEANQGSVIENAHWGISTTAWGEWLGEGIIRCDGTTFKNNSSSAIIATRNGVELTRKPFDATFRNCQFINNDDNRNDKFWVFIASYNTEGSPGNPDGVLIENCSFVDRQLNSTYPIPYNAGVSTLNGNATIRDCYFEELYFGVHARNGVGLFPNLDVLSSTFESCKYGVSNTGISGAVIEDNDFLLSHNILFPSKHDEWVGIILQDGMLGTRVEKNTFNAFLDVPGVETKGIYINDIGSWNTEIRKNEFRYMNYANIARGDNAVEGGGLHYLCNTNARNINTDFMAFDGEALRQAQGWFNPQDFVFDPAANTFSKDLYPGVDWHFENISSAAVDYYYNPTDYSQTPEDFVGIFLRPAFDDRHCTLSRTRPELESPEDAVANEQLYQQHLPEHQAAVQAYDQALLIGDQNQIRIAQAALTYQTQLLQEIIMLGLSYAHHTVHDRDQTRLWLTRVDSKVADYLLAGDHFEHGEYQAGLALLATMTESRHIEGEGLIDHGHVISIYEHIANGALDEFNSMFEDELVGYADAGDGRSSFLARTLLMNIGTYYDPITDVPHGVEERRSEVSTEVLGIAYPNPARAVVNFDLTEIGEANALPTHIMIYDGLGRLVDVISIPNEANTIQWPTSQVDGGVYLFDIQSRGESLHVGQVVIMK